MCDMSDFFERAGEVWAIRSRDGERMLPVLFCPFCGNRIEYGHCEKENEEERE